LKGRNDEDTIRVGDIKQYQPFTNWEKYFSRKVECDSAYLKSKWGKLYEYRCKIAHCKGITKLEFDDLKAISIDICEKIEAALDSIGDVHIEEAEREELAENFSGNANKNVAEFIAKYNKLVILSQEACELSSNDQDTYKNHDTNKTNIRMQSKYLHLTKGVIDKETSNLIDRAQTFRNKVVHKVGIVNITEAEIIEEICSIDLAINVLLFLNPENLKQLQGVDIRNSSLQEN
jgi:hypothetical protein